MARLSTSCCFPNPLITPNIPLISHSNTRSDYYKGNNQLRGQRFVITSASKSGGFSLKSIDPRGCEFESPQEQGGKFLEGRMPGVYLETASLSQCRDKIVNRCGNCGGQGAIECPGCKGTGKNKKNGNIFERWKCFDCQGFGLKSCPVCGKGGLTPEQRGER